MQKKNKLNVLISVAILAVLVVGFFTYKSFADITKFFSGNNTTQEETSIENETTANSETTQEPASQEVSTQEDTTATVETQTTVENTTLNIETTQVKYTPNFPKDLKIKAIYLSGSSAGSTKVLDHYIDLIKKTELNAVVIDVKEGGKVNFKSSIPFVLDNDLYVKYYDVDKVIQRLHYNNIYVIGRVVCFRDSGLTSKRPELAVKRTDGSTWTEGSMGAWINPYLEDGWKYNIEIAKEAVSKGFDEIQFDYVRFPTAKKSEVSYGSETRTKVDAICGFLKMAKEELGGETGVPVSADVFGIIAESKSDGEAIGQDLERVGMDIDYISPMVYPSHYAKGQQVNGVTFAKPDFDPYGVVYQTLLKIKDRIALVPNYKAGIRPYLQDFTASYLHSGDYQEYGVEQVRQQIKAVYDAGYEQWIFWDGRNTYTDSAFQIE